MKNDKVLPTGEATGVPVRCQATPSNRILVVEDEVDIRQVSAAVLSHFGYHTETAADGAAAWEALQANNYDLLITDNNMPKVSGVELVKKVRSAHMTLPVILASGALPTEELLGAFNGNVTPHLYPIAIRIRKFVLATTPTHHQPVPCLRSGKTSMGETPYGQPRPGCPAPPRSIFTPCASRPKPRTIFRMSERIHSAKEFEGTGVGPGILCKAVERMGAQIGFESELSKRRRKDC